MSATDITDRSYRANVARGVEYLDGAVPGWWLPGRIDLDTLDVADATDCVFGQLYADEDNLDCCGWCDGSAEFVNATGIDDTWLYGFDAPADADEPFELFETNTEWRRVILERRAA